MGLYGYVITGSQRGVIGYMQRMVKGSVSVLYVGDDTEGFIIDVVNRGADFFLNCGGESVLILSGLSLTINRAL